MLWTTEAIEDLKRLAREGRSASAIAKALGLSSRNAVIGKASRSGIKLGGGARASKGGRRPSPAPSGLRPIGGRPGPAASLGREETGAVREPEIGEMQRVRFEEIREFACRWPVGDPRSGDLVYCGLERAEGYSYCAGHCRMAYRPAKTGGQNGRSRAHREAVAAAP